MNYYEARQNKDTGKWAFTKMRDHNIWKVGYCRDLDHEHNTKEEAIDCYAKYLLDTQLKFRPHKEGEEGTYHKCRECGTLSNGYAQIDCEIIFLCNDHQNRETVEKYYQKSGTIISSW